MDLRARQSKNSLVELAAHSSQCRTGHSLSYWLLRMGPSAATRPLVSHAIGINRLLTAGGAWSSLVGTLVTAARIAPVGFSRYLLAPLRSTSEAAPRPSAHGLCHFYVVHNPSGHHAGPDVTTIAVMSSLASAGHRARAS